MKREYFWIIAIITVLAVFVVDFAPSVGKVDDWSYSSQQNKLLEQSVYAASQYPFSNLYGHNFRSMGSIVAYSVHPPLIAYMHTQSAGTTFSTGKIGGFQSLNAQLESTDLGFAAGGAKDINNFRDNINNSYLPLKTDIPYEGLFYEYYFDTGQKEECKQLFCPSYSKAVSEHPISNETEYFTTVGLNSNLEESEFDRKKVNLVVVMDVSGSMDSSFDNYYYDRFGNRKEVENYTGKSKMKVAQESLQGLRKHLRKGDRVGVVLYNGNAQKAKPLNSVEKTDMGAIRDHIAEIRAGGGTNMESGMDLGSKMLEEYQNVDQTKYENRMIFMTDAMPNIGATSDEGILTKMGLNAERNIHTTFVGIGVDFNTELVDNINGVKGANSFSVHSSKEFENRMDRDFKYMVTPLVYNLSVELKSDNFDIEQVYGSSVAEESTSEVMKVKTLFPSRKKEGKTKGGIVLAELNKKEESQLELVVTYGKRNGEQKQVTQKINFSESPEYYENTGIRKAVLLQRYAELMKNWVEHERENNIESGEELETKPEGDGYVNPRRSRLGEQERRSDPLILSKKYSEKLKTFKNYFENETEQFEDETLDKEIKTMENILEKAVSPT